MLTQVRFRLFCSDSFPCFNHFNNSPILGCILTSPDCNHSPHKTRRDVIKQCRLSFRIQESSFWGDTEHVTALQCYTAEGGTLPETGHLLPVGPGHTLPVALALESADSAVIRA